MFLVLPISGMCLALLLIGVFAGARAFLSFL